MLRSITLVTLLLSFAGQLSADDTAKFLATHCVRCHGATKPKADLRLDVLPWQPGEESNLEMWLSIVDRVDAGEMPPEGQPQPVQTDRATFLKSLRGRIAEAAREGSQQSVLRRLNRAQFRNSLRDLLHIDVDVEDPTEAFPADDKEEGFDNLGETLQMSDFLLRQYLKVSRTAVDRATFEGEMPKARTYTLSDAKSRPLNFKSSARPTGKDHVLLYRNDERAPGDPRGQSFINCREGATHDGWYEFTFEVESRGRGNFAEELREQKRNDYQVYRAEDLHRFELYLTAPSAKSSVQTRPRHLVLSVDLPDNERRTIERRLWLPKGWRVEAAFGNGYCSSTPTALLEIIDPDFDGGILEDLSTAERRRKGTQILVDQLDEREVPRIVVHNVTETGPHYDQWPPASHTTVYGKPGQSVEEHLTEFATRAFRRPVTSEQIAPFVRLAERSPEGVRTAIEAILCSPRFVYLKETGDELDDYAVASRLSYFLWNTMPDDELLADAAKGRLRTPDVLSGHVDRMLADERSDVFVESFVWAWLKLDNTVEMAPDPMKFYDFHRNRIGEAMLRETTTFFRHVLDENLPLSTFVESDFTFLNADLARHYGLPGVVSTTARLQRVALTGSSRRGGLLGQTSVLSASANGVDTSPVVRGIWILENLMGTPPSPPPPGVEVPEPDARGNLTIRELYAKHRTIQSCNDCHKKIDPLGFSLENFDAVGGWRPKYESGHDVDPSGTMPNGKSFDDVTGLKEIMVGDMDQFSRNLTSKLSTYATGRTMTALDRPEIDDVVARLNSERGGLRDLVRSVVLSRVFLHK